MTLLRTLSVLFVAAPLAFADTYPRQTAVDTIHYVFRLSVNDDNDETAGEATADVRLLRDGLTEFSLDLASSKDGKGMTVSGVKCGGMERQEFLDFMNDVIALHSGKVIPVILDNLNTHKPKQTVGWRGTQTCTFTSSPPTRPGRTWWKSGSAF